MSARFERRRAARPGFSLTALTALAFVALAASVVGTSGCAAFRVVTAANDDLRDYRAYRLAEHEGVRLARAQRYLAAHPRGAWVDEVRQAYDEGEDAYFERAKTSRDAAREYLTYLPDGPHAPAAVLLMTTFDAKKSDEATEALVREARRTEALLEKASNQRRAVSESLVAILVAIADRENLGRPLAETSVAFRRALDGGHATTWGSPPRSRSFELFFSVPTERARESRALTVTVTATGGAVVDGARIEGEDLVVRWAEADASRAFDAERPLERRAAAVHVRELLAGALEATMPVARCDAQGGADIFFLRDCDGMRVLARLGPEAGSVDRIEVLRTAEDAPPAAGEMR